MYNQCVCCYNNDGKTSSEEELLCSQIRDLSIGDSRKSVQNSWVSQPGVRITQITDQLAYHTSDFPALSDAADSRISTGNYLPVCEFCLSDQKCDTKLGTQSVPSTEGPLLYNSVYLESPLRDVLLQNPTGVTGKGFSHHEEVSGITLTSPLGFRIVGGE